MRIFFDTCTVVDYLCNRTNAQIVEGILTLAREREWKCYISVGSFYTLTYLIELHLKKSRYQVKEERIQKLREILDKILSEFCISDIFAYDLVSAIHDSSFSDLEDSYQYRAALAAGCDFLITINMRDFKDANEENIKILEPSDFFSALERY